MTEETPQPLDSRRHVAWILCVIVVLGLALRGYQLTVRPIWFDEAFSWRLSQFPLPELLSRAARDNNPPLYYLLLKAWCGVFGESLLALRSLNVLFGGMTIVGMYLFTSEALSRAATGGSNRETLRRARGAGLFVAALVAVSVFQIFWAQQARMYSLGTALVAFSSWAMFRAIRPESRWQHWAAFGAWTVLFAYTHTYALFSIAAQVCFLLGFLFVRSGRSLPAMIRSTQFRMALLAAAIFVACWIPWVPILATQRAQVAKEFWAVPIGGWDVPMVCYEMFVEPIFAGRNRTYAAITATLCVLGFLGLAWRARAGEWYLLAAALAPFVLSVLITQFVTPIFTLRYFLFANLFFLAALGVLVWRIPHGLARGLTVMALLAGATTAQGVFWTKLRIEQRVGIQSALAHIESQRKPGEPIIVCNALLYFTAAYHARDPQDCRMYNDGRKVVHYFGGAVVTPEDLATAKQLEAIQAETVWVLNMHGGWWQNLAAPVPVPENWYVKSRRHFEELLGPKEIDLVAYGIKACPEPQTLAKRPASNQDRR